MRQLDIREVGLVLYEIPDDHGDRAFEVHYDGWPIGILVRDAAVFRQGRDAWFVPFIRGPQANCDGMESGWQVNDAMFDSRSPLYVSARRHLPVFAEGESMFFPTAAQAAIWMLRLLVLCGGRSLNYRHEDALWQTQGIAFEYVSEWD